MSFLSKALDPTLKTNYCRYSTINISKYLPYLLTENESEATLEHAVLRATHVISEKRVAELVEESNNKCNALNKKIDGLELENALLRTKNLLLEKRVKELELALKKTKEGSGFSRAAEGLNSDNYLEADKSNQESGGDDEKETEIIYDRIVNLIDNMKCDCEKAINLSLKSRLPQLPTKKDTINSINKTATNPCRPQSSQSQLSVLTRFPPGNFIQSTRNRAPNPSLTGVRPIDRSKDLCSRTSATKTHLIDPSFCTSPAPCITDHKYSTKSNPTDLVPTSLHPNPTNSRQSDFSLTLTKPSPTKSCPIPLHPKTKPNQMRPTNTRRKVCKVNNRLLPKAKIHSAEIDSISFSPIKSKKSSLSYSILLNIN